MRAFWILFGHELRARRDALAGSIGVGLLAAAVPAIPFVHTTLPEFIRGTATVVAAALWSLALAIVFGATAFAPDLRERRLAFEFRLPASAAAIGTARLLAGALCMLAGGALAFVLPIPFGVDLSVLSLFAGQFVLVPLALALAFLLAHAAALSLAGDRRWMALDFASVVVAVAGVAFAWSGLDSDLLLEGGLRVASFSGALLALGLLTAVVVQLRVGRSELDRAHRAFSLTFAGAAIVVAIFATAFAH
jgi:hypothetical protein